MKFERDYSSLSMNAAVIFLFNHDAGHQVAHSAGVAGAMAQSDRPTVIAYGKDAIRVELCRLLSPEQQRRLHWMPLALPAWLDALLSPINRLLPIKRLARLYWHRKALRRAAMIVSTERTCLTLKRHWSRRGKAAKMPAFAYIPHGSGDRNVAVHPALKQFDLCLVSGQKVVDQLVSAGVSTPEKCRIIGYTKFDILIGREPEKFFDNDRPVCLYNPHFDPHMSSWFDHGPALLRWFAGHPDFNLIFAPHVMLFFKHLHISPEYKVSRRRPDIPPEILSAPNIRIDTDSSRLFDMSYTLAADIYIGDVSSQIYEFLYTPGACFFFDVHSGNQAGEAPVYDFWNNGPVVRSVDELAALLPDHAAIAADHLAAQQDRMNQTADRSDPRPAAERARDAILNFLREGQS